MQEIFTGIDIKLLITIIFILIALVLLIIQKAILDVSSRYHDEVNLLIYIHTIIQNTKFSNPEDFIPFPLKHRIFKNYKHFLTDGDITLGGEIANQPLYLRFLDLLRIFLSAPVMSIITFREAYSNYKSGRYAFVQTSDRVAGFSATIFFIISSFIYVFIASFLISPELIQKMSTKPEELSVFDSLAVAFGIWFFLGGSFGVLSGLILIIFLIIWQARWKKYWKDVFLLLMINAMNANNLDLYIHIKTLYDDIDSKPVLLLTKQFALLSSLYGLIQAIFLIAAI